MVMVHSRPGFAPVITETPKVPKGPAPAKLNDDMVPALQRSQKAAPSPLDARTAVAMEKLKTEAATMPQPRGTVLPPGVEIIPNPAPTEPPKILEPGK